MVVEEVEQGGGVEEDEVDAENEPVFWGEGGDGVEGAGAWVGIDEGREARVGVVRVGDGEGDREVEGVAEVGQGIELSEAGREAETVFGNSHAAAGTALEDEDVDVPDHGWGAAGVVPAGRRARARKAAMASETPT